MNGTLPYTPLVVSWHNGPLLSKQFDDDDDNDDDVVVTEQNQTFCVHLTLNSNSVRFTVQRNIL